VVAQTAKHADKATVEIKNETERLSEELQHMTTQRDNLAVLIQTLVALLNEVSQKHLLINRDAWRAVLPKLEKCPAPAMQTLLYLLADLDEAGVTRQAWTGLQLGTALGLSKATRDRLLGPLEAMGILAAERRGKRKAKHYRLHIVVNNTLLERIAAVQIRCRSVLSGPVVEPVGPTPPLSNTLVERTAVANTLQERISSPNTLPTRIDALDDVESESNAPDSGNPSTTNTPWSSAALEIIQDAYRGLGLSHDLKQKLFNLPAERALALILQAREKGTRNKAGLLRRMLEDQSDPLVEFEQHAHKKLHMEAYKEAEDLLVEAEETPNSPWPQRRTAPPPDEIGLDETPGNGHWTMRQAWPLVLNQLQIQLNRSTFDSWLAHSIPEHFEDGVLTVRVRYAYGPEWLEKHAQHLVERCLASIVETPIPVRWISEARLAQGDAWGAMLRLLYNDETCDEAAAR